MMMDTPDDLKIESSDSISTLTSIFEKKPQSVFFSQFSRNKNKKEVSSESLIKIFATHQSANYAEPWVGSSAEECTGSGFVIQHNSTNYIVTNAHVAGDSKYIQVRIAGKNKKYTAVPLQVCYQSDLAILAVKDLAFQQQSKPVAIGDMVALQESVKVMGFPIGGDGLSVTEGIVSRVESGTYEIGRVKMLQIQIDAAINPGNSGGPVFSEGKVIGVAFQGRDDGESLGYIIPAPILNHFLQECFQEKSYQGFPELPIKITELENEYLRSHYGMDTEQTGVLISQIDGLSDAALKLKKDDILLAISGFPISNEGKVNLPGIEEEVDFTHLFHMHYIGDSIELEVLRQGELVSISVLLDCTPHQTKKLSQDEHDKLPTYYFASGVLFQPLTMNYFESKMEKEGVLDPMMLYHFPGIGTIHEVPKSSPNDQFIFINKILNCDENQGYARCEKEFVDKINGISVSNIRDVVKAIEKNKEPVHMVSLISGEKLALKNMSKKEHRTLLSNYGIKQDRSEDLIMEREEAKAIQKNEQAISNKSYRKKKYR